MNKSAQPVKTKATKAEVLLEDFLLPRIPRKLYATEARLVRDVLRQVAELDHSDHYLKEHDDMAAAIGRVRTLLQILGEVEFVKQCDEKDYGENPLD